MEPNVGAGLLHLGSPICLTKQFVPGDKDSGLPSSFVTSPQNNKETQHVQMQNKGAAGEAKPELRWAMLHVQDTRSQ